MCFPLIPGFLGGGRGRRGEGGRGREREGGAIVCPWRRVEWLGSCFGLLRVEEMEGVVRVQGFWGFWGWMRWRGRRGKYSCGISTLGFETAFGLGG